jgi:hypothetical protein
VLISIHGCCSNNKCNGEDSLRDSRQVPALPCGASCVVLISVMDVVRTINTTARIRCAIAVRSPQRLDAFEDGDDFNLMNA